MSSEIMRFAVDEDPAAVEWNDPSYEDRELEAQEASDYPPPSIDALVSAGRFVVVAEFPQYSTINDALIGTGRCAISDHATRAEAEAAIPEDEDELRHFVLPAAPIEMCHDHPTEPRHTCDMHPLYPRDPWSSADIKDDEIVF